MRTLILCLLLLGITAKTDAQEVKMAVQLNHTAIYVKDLPKAAFFYEHVIGLDTIPEPFRIGRHKWFRIGPKMALHIILGATEVKEYYKNQHTCFSVSDMKLFVDRLKKNNVVFEDVNGNQGAITKRVDGVQQIWFRDPDGYWIEVNDARE
ncbi:MAG: VOC family protein [Chitinophagaceae bacterium]|nr:VOC family protein [Chitinophagaceae bacterium]